MGGSSGGLYQQGVRVRSVIKGGDAVWPACLGVLAVAVDLRKKGERFRSPLVLQPDNATTCCE